MLLYGNSNSGVHQATDAALPLQEFRPSFPSAIFVETRDSGTCWDELDFRCETSRQRQPPTIVTWAELDFYDLPLIRPSGFVNSGRQRFSSQELLELLGDGRRYDYHRMLSRFLPIIPNRHVIPLKKARS